MSDIKEIDIIDVHQIFEDSLASCKESLNARDIADYFYDAIDKLFYPEAYENEQT